MFGLFIGALILSQYVFYNYGHLCLWLIRIYSRVQMKLLTHQEKEKEEEEEDGLECFVGKRIIKHITMNNAMDKINDSELAVIRLNKNMIIFYPPIDSFFLDYEKSNVTFISVIVNIEDGEQYEIKLKTPSYSFYVVGNELNVDFVRYYLLKFKNVYLAPDVEYTMTIVDNNVNFYSVDQNECVAFEKDNYQIFTYKDQEGEGEGEGEVKDEEGEEEVKEQEVKDEEGEGEEEIKEQCVSVLEDECASMDIDQLINIEQEMDIEQYDMLGC